MLTLIALMSVSMEPGTHSARFEVLIQQAEYYRPGSSPQGEHKDKSKAIQCYEEALALGEDSKDNLVHEFHLGGLLLGMDDQPERVHQGVAVFEGILRKYNYMDYYQAHPRYSGNDPQYMMITVAVYAGLHQHDKDEARKRYLRGMEMLYQTYLRRRVDWLNEPPPQRPSEPFGGVDPEGKWRLAMREWERRQRQAESGHVFRLGQEELMRIEALVKHYLNSYGETGAEDVPTLLQPLINKFPDSPIEDEVRKQIKLAAIRMKDAA